MIPHGRALSGWNWNNLSNRRNNYVFKLYFKVVVVFFKESVQIQINKWTTGE